MFDSHGIQIWNAATNILRDDARQSAPVSESRSTAHFVALLRTFAFLLLDAAHLTLARHMQDPDQQTRTFKIANKACRFCLDTGELDLALRVLERSSDYVGAAEEALPIVQITDEVDGRLVQHRSALRRLVSEYYLLRMTHAWKSDRFDMADHFFNKVGTRELVISSELAEKAADLFHEAGRFLAHKREPQSTIKWCERALAVLDAVGVENLSQDAPDLRLAVTSTLVEALLIIASAANCSRATILVDELESIYGMSNRMAVLIMRFRLLIARQPVDNGSLHEVLRHMIRRALMTDHNFKLYVHCMTIMDITWADDIDADSCRPYTKLDGTVHSARSPHLKISFNLGYYQTLRLTPTKQVSPVSAWRRRSLRMCYLRSKKQRRRRVM